MWCQDAEYVGLARNGEWHYHAMSTLLLERKAFRFGDPPRMAVDCEHCGWWHEVKLPRG